MAWTKIQRETRGPRWPWIAHLIFWDWSSQFFFVAFREEFTTISLCLYSARSLHSLIPCLLTDQNFKNNSEKGHSRNISMRLFQNLTNSFREDFYTPVEDRTYYGITRGGRASRRRPVLCPEHISKTTLARVMKFHGWIDLIQGECSAQES